MGTETMTTRETQDDLPATTKHDPFAVVKEKTGELAISPLAAAAVAQIQARYQVAIARPRDIDKARSKMLHECERPTFAKAAVYEKPVGGGEVAVGPSIRFAEMAARMLGNLLVGSFVKSDDGKRRIVAAYATDLESNLTFEKDVEVEWTVERKTPPKGRKIKGERFNSYGEVTFLIEANEGEMVVKTAAEVSKAKRELIMGHVPGDIVADCSEKIAETSKKKDAEDPDKAKKEIIDGFAELRVMPDQLVELLGHAIDASTPAEIERLRRLYVTLRDGETTWPQIMELARAPAKPEASGTGGGAEPKKGPLANMTDRARAMSVTASGGSGAGTSRSPAETKDQLRETIRHAAMFLGPDAVESAYASCELSLEVDETTLPIETLRQLAAALSAEEAKQQQAEAAKKAADAAATKAPEAAPSTAPATTSQADALKEVQRLEILAFRGKDPQLVAAAARGCGANPAKPSTTWTPEQRATVIEKCREAIARG